MISMPKFENKVCSGIHFSETLRLRRVITLFGYLLSQKHCSEEAIS
jgi:uncharacterized membrane protein YadS